MWTVSELKKQLKDERFQVYFVPHYDIGTMEMCGAETLVLYLTKENTLEDLSTMLPVLEENDLVSILDLWVLNKVCRIQQEIFRRGLYIYPIYINLSVWTVCNPYHIYDIVLEQKNFRLPQKTINVALNTTRPYLSVSGLNQGLSFLQKKGMEIMLSQFGSEFTTSGFFSEVCFDKLQITAHFLKKAMNSERMEIILNHMIMLSDSLNMTIVLDGIDSLSEYQYVKDMGRHCARGDFFGNKLTEEEFIKKVMGIEN